nr:MAG TPA: hypothetical protein [Bacteriophage sp.]
MPRCIKSGFFFVLWRKRGEIVTFKNRVPSYII